MKKILILAALAAMATPAVASANDFAGPRVGVVAGTSGDTAGFNQFTYGVNAGYDLAVTKNVRVGATVEYVDSEALNGTISGRNAEVSVIGRVGYKLSENVLAYGLVGYSALLKQNENTTVKKDRNGNRYGAGLEYAVSDNVYAGAEYRYSDYERGDQMNRSVEVQEDENHAVMLTVGYRF